MICLVSMHASRTTRILSGSGDSVESIVLECESGCHLDDGVATSVLSYVLQRIEEELGENPAMSALSVIGRKSELPLKLRLANHYRIGPVDDISVAQTLSKIGESVSDSSSVKHIVLLDTFGSLLSALSLRKYMQLLDVGRTYPKDKDIARLCIFVCILCADDFNRQTADLVRRFATTHIIVRQQRGKSQLAVDFEVWDEVALHVRRRKTSGRLNSDTLTAHFDAHSKTLQNVVVRAPDIDTPATQTDAEQDSYIEQLQVPFKLSLSDAERRSRSAVALPYAHKNAEIADAGLVLHPSHLQVPSLRRVARKDHREDEEEEEQEDAQYEDEDGEELFSEDV